MASWLMKGRGKPSLRRILAHARTKANNHSWAGTDSSTVGLHEPFCKILRVHVFRPIEENSLVT